MKTAFFSEEGRNAVTSNLACIAVMGALCRDEKTVMFENHYNRNSLEQAFFKEEQTLKVREENGYLCQEGLDGLMRGIHSGFMKPSLVETAALSVMRNRLYVIPGSHIIDGKFFSREFGRVMKPLFTLLEDFSENVFIDTGGWDNESTDMILSEADLVVVNLNQSPSHIRNFFEKHGKLLDKTIFLIGGYQEESKYNLGTIAASYPISRKKLAVIPYNVELHDAMQEGKLVPFLIRNYRNVRGEKYYRFMKALKNASDLVFDTIEDERKKRKVYQKDA